jgi:hypothetical protein
MRLNLSFTFYFQVYNPYSEFSETNMSQKKCYGQKSWYEEKMGPRES